MADPLQQQLQALFQQVQQLTQANQQLEQQMHDEDLQIAQQAEEAEKAVKEAEQAKAEQLKAEQAKAEQKNAQQQVNPVFALANAALGKKSQRKRRASAMPDSDDDSNDSDGDMHDGLNDDMNGGLGDMGEGIGEDGDVGADGGNKNISGAPPEVLAFIEKQKLKLGPKKEDPRKKKKKVVKVKKNPDLVRKRYSNKEKYTIVKLMDEGYTKKQIMKEFNLPKNTLNVWLSKDRQSIIDAIETRMELTRKSLQDSAIFGLMEEPLLEFVEANAKLPPSERVQMTSVVISEKALQLREELMEKDKNEKFLTPKERRALQTFGASTAWSSRFARKNAWRCKALRTRKRGRRGKNEVIDEESVEEEEEEEDEIDENMLPDDKITSWMENSQEMVRSIARDGRFEKHLDKLRGVLFQLELTWKREKIWSNVMKKKKMMEKGVDKGWDKESDNKEKKQPKFKLDDDDDDEDDIDDMDDDEGGVNDMGADEMGDEMDDDIDEEMHTGHAGADDSDLDVEGFEV